jgi:two-component system CheB/CheR fusion protein
MVVGIGASAGGLKALLEFFDKTPPDAGMAYVVVVHLSPEHSSRMTDLLQPSTAMPVRAVTETTTIEPNHVYVISPKSQLRIDDGKLEPTKSARPPGSAMTIDVFLETLARAHENRAVGVILSGMGSDGTRGIRAIKAHGGITIAQAPEESEYDSMPRSAIGTGDIDFVLPVRDMAAKIGALWRNAQTIEIPPLPDRPTAEDVQAEAEEAMRDILSTVRARTGHDFSQYKRATLARRIERRLQVNQLRSLGEYREFITDHSAEAAALLRDLLISVTWFFRDPHAWETLDKRVLPTLFEERADGGNVRAWIVGCATGEEVYSLAMLLCEHMDSMNQPPAASIFATDIDEEALRYARYGLYPHSIAEHVPAERLRRFFVPEQAGYRVQKRLREMVMFATHNVIQDAPFSRLDLVCCRNLLIYLTRAVQSKVLDLLHFSLRPEGYLFLGMSESIDDAHDGFAAVSKSNRLFAQQPRGRNGVALPAVATLVPRRQSGEAVASAGRRLISFGELHQRLLEHYAAPSIVVDEQYNIVHLSDHAGHFLRFGGGEPSLHLLRVAPAIVRYELKAALDQALKSMRTVERTALTFRREPHRLQIDVKVHPVRDRSTGRTFALVIFGEAGAEGQSSVPAPPADLPAETGHLEERLREMDVQLADSIEQYEVQNEELKASNEELQATNEELRAATEELETGKEELQSINEELVTVNQELKNKVDEAMRISDDLTNFVTATGIASLFVDRDMRLMRYTPFAREIFNVIPSDIGRPLSHITHRLEGIDLVDCIQRVFEPLTVFEMEVKSGADRWYIVRILPYRTTDDRILGAVLTFIDISRRKHAEEAWSRLVVESVREYAIITLDSAGIVRTWNPGARTIFGYDESEIVGKDIAAIFTPEDRDAGVPTDEMRRARETGRAEDDRWQLRKDGTRFFASGVLAPFDVADALGYVKILRDVTEQKLAERRQQQLLDEERIRSAAAEEANRLKDAFLATLSHELRNPLSLLLMQAEILSRAPEAKKSERLMRAASVIQEMVRAQAQLIEDMIDVSRARTGKLTIDRQLLPLTFVVADSIGALRREAEKKDVTFDVQTGESSLIVAADPVRVRQIAWNLLTNALKFTPPKGSIRVRLTRDGNDARLDVEDTGEGISPEAMPHIFEWFRYADGEVQRHGGMGIGLALVRQLVELHEGRIEAHSEGKGKGARFSVWLPLNLTALPLNLAAPAVDRPAANPADARRLDGLSILVVDDSEPNTAALRDLLQIEGAKVTSESLPIRAIEAADRQRFDLVISDIAMPDIDGYDTMKAIRNSKKNANTPAIAYSGYSGQKEVDRARAAGFDRHLAKPLDAESLVGTILEVARSRRAAD